MGEGWITISKAAQKIHTSEQNIILWAHQGKLESDGEKIKESSLVSVIGQEI